MKKQWRGKRWLAEVGCLLLATSLLTGCSESFDTWYDEIEDFDSGDYSDGNGGIDIDESSTGGAGTDGSSTGGAVNLSDVSSWFVNSNDPEQQLHPKSPELFYLYDLKVPAYSGEPYVMINDGVPFFDTETIEPVSYELYYDLDELGRCTLADAVLGKDLMPTEKRGNISSVKPTGWHSDKYDKSLVDGESLYNRCHLIAFGMCGENANKYNLVTGTRYFNTKGVNDFENLVIDYVRETDNHVRYRVTPVWTGDNLICDGEIIEAWSIEDAGEAVCFNIYAYNVQPGILIDYATGDNWLEGNAGNTSGTASGSDLGANQEKEWLLKEDIIGDFVLNTRNQKIHLPDCRGALNLSEKNRKDYSGSYNDLIREGYVPDYACMRFAWEEQ